MSVEWDIRFVISGRCLWSTYFFMYRLIFLCSIYFLMAELYIRLKIVGRLFVYVVADFLIYVVTDLSTEIWVYVNQSQNNVWLNLVYINFKSGLFLWRLCNTSWATIQKKPGGKWTEISIQSSLDLCWDILNLIKGSHLILLKDSKNCQWCSW